MKVMKLVDINVLLHNIEELNIASFYEENQHSKEAYQEIKQMMLNTPIVYTDTSPTGYWISDIVNAKCSICGGRGSTAYRYCPHCGANMRRVNDVQ